MINKPSLGIYGCSFAADSSIPFPEKSWVDFIRETKLYHITNLAKSGTSLWYSYDLFTKTNQKFDKIIFLSSTQHRLTIPDYSSLTIPKDQHYSQICQMFSHSTGQEKNEYELLMNYFDLVHNFEKEEDHHSLMIKNLKNIRPDVIFYEGSSIYPDVFTLLSISLWESKMMGNEITRSGKLLYRSSRHKRNMNDFRRCHLTEENNKLVAEMFLARLRGENKSIDYSDLIKPTKSLEYYLFPDQ